MNINIDEKKYPYALIYYFGEMFLGMTEKTGEINWSECLEARFFGNGSELRIWRDNGELMEAECSPEGELLDLEYKLQKENEEGWKKVTIRKMIDYDEDGQAYVKNTIVAGLGR